MDFPFVVGISPTLNIRGLIACEDIKKGVIVESCPLIFVNAKDEEALLEKTIMGKYYYEWTKKHHAIVLGYGSLLNHSYEPNLKYFFYYKQERLVYKAIRDIQAGEELTINYNWDPDNKDPVDPEHVDFNENLATK